MVIQKVSPNPRLQRTRLRAPLSRKPLGSSEGAFRRLVPILMTLALLGTADSLADGCRGHLVVSLVSNGIFSKPFGDVRFPLAGSDPALILRVEMDHGDDWPLSVFRESDRELRENLIGEGLGCTVDGKVQIAAINLPCYGQGSLVLPIRSTDRSICVSFAKVKARGGGAHAAFLKGSRIEVRLVPKGMAHAA